jgi:hypothetical protein
MHIHRNATSDPYQNTRVEPSTSSDDNMSMSPASNTNRGNHNTNYYYSHKLLHRPGSCDAQHKVARQAGLTIPVKVHHQAWHGRGYRGATGHDLWDEGGRLLPRVPVPNNCPRVCHQPKVSPPVGVYCAQTAGWKGTGEDGREVGEGWGSAM